MRIPFFDLNSQISAYRDEILDGVGSVLDSGTFIGGSALLDFENEFARYLGVTGAVGVGNGLDALRIILESLGIGPGDEVIVPGFTFYATWLAVMQVGATPKFADVNLGDATLEIPAVRDLINAKTKAILVVHLYGNPADLVALRHLAAENRIFLVEDAAQAHGAVRDGVQVGAAGHAAAFSFYPTKNLGALGDGGAITSDDEDLLSMCRSKRSYGQGKSKYEHVLSGWNSRLDPVQAKILSIHLDKLSDFTSRRRRIAEQYFNSIGEFSSFVVGPKDVEKSVWHLFVIRVTDRENAVKLFEQNGIATDIHYPYFSYSVGPVSKYLTELDEMSVRDLSNSRMLSETVLSLPIGPWMTDEQVSRVSSVLRKLKNDIFKK